MARDDIIEHLLRKGDRRAFLKAVGVVGVGAMAGGGLRSAFKVLGEDTAVLSRTRPAMGTFVEVKAVHESHDLAVEAVELAYAEMDRLIAILSHHDSSTPLWHLNSRGTLTDPPVALTDVVVHSLEMHRRTSGVFDPTVKPLVDLLEASGNSLPGAAELRDAVALVGADGIRFSDHRIELEREGMGVTLDGVAKGYIVDRMSDRLAAAGVTNHLVNAGGDIRTRGERAPGRPWVIAIQDPKKQGNYPDVVRMRDGAIATSGGYENFYDDARSRHHIIDPATGRSPIEYVSVSVRAGSVVEADALSTGLMVSPRRLADDTALSYLLVRSDGAQQRSRGWTGASRES